MKKKKKRENRKKAPQSLDGRKTRDQRNALPPAALRALEDPTKMNSSHIFGFSSYVGLPRRVYWSCPARRVHPAQHGPLNQPAAYTLAVRLRRHA